MIIIVLGTAGCLPLAVYHLSKGFYYLAAWQSPAAVADLKNRRMEQAYIYEGQNPLDHYLLFKAEEQHQSLRLPRVVRRDPRIGVIYASGFPPWTYFDHALLYLVAVDEQGARIWFAFLNAIALAWIACAAFRIGLPFGRSAGVFLVAAVLANSAHNATLTAGQNGIIIVALLMAVLVLLDKPPTLSTEFLIGLCFAFAMAKPTIAALFGGVLLVKRRMLALGVSIAYLLIATVVVSIAVHTNPVELTREFFLTAADVIAQGSNVFLSALLALGIDRALAATGLAAAGGLLTFLLLYLRRTESALPLFAIVAPLGLLWSYHRSYDDVMLVFLVLAVGVLMLSRPRPLYVLTFLLLGASLWLPYSMYYGNESIQVLQTVAWLVALAVVALARPVAHAAVR